MQDNINTKDNKVTFNGSTFISPSSGEKWLSLSFKKNKKDRSDIAFTYFQLLSAFNNIKLSTTEIKLLAHVAVNRGIVSGSCKMSYVAKYGSSVANVDNLVSKLKKKKLLTKGDTVILNPKINLDFLTNDNFIFYFKCTLEK